MTLYKCLDSEFHLTDQALKGREEIVFMTENKLRNIFYPNGEPLGVQLRGDIWQGGFS